MTDQHEVREHYEKETLEGNEQPVNDPSATPAGWMVAHPEDYRLSEDGYLEWDKLSPRENRRVLPSAAMLDQFVKLADGDGHAVLAFAHQYGPLVPSIALEPSLPLTYSFTYPPRLLNIIECQPKEPPSPDQSIDGSLSPPTAEPSGPMLPAGRERIEGWKELASEARAFLSIANRLHQNWPQRAEDWAALNGASDPEAKMGDRAAIMAAGGYCAPPANIRRLELANHFRGWSAGAIRGISIHWWESSVPVVGIEGFGLFGAIVLRVAAGIARGSRWVPCTYCGEYFLARQDARRKYGPFCANCKHKAGNAATNAWRANRRNEAAAAGVSEDEVKRRRATARARKGTGSTQTHTQTALDGGKQG